MKAFLTIVVVILFYCIGDAQEDMIYTNALTKKLRFHQIDFFQPVERWLHITNITDDEFMDYDAVLRDEQGLEVRLNIQEADKMYSQHPHIELIRMIADISTNDDEADILVSQLNTEWVTEKYQADWGLYADFTPKRAFSNYPKGRILCLYKEGRALVNYIVLHDEEELDPFFEFPLSFQ